MKIRTYAAAALLLAAALSAAFPAATRAIAEECGVRDDGRLYCRNTPDIVLSADAVPNADDTGVLKSDFSWFQCWVDGYPHAGGNNIWYLTKGDEAVAPYRGWGFLAANHLATAQDPAPGLRECAKADYDLI